MTTTEERPEAEPSEEPTTEPTEEALPEPTKAEVRKVAAETNRIEKSMTDDEAAEVLDTAS